MAKKPKLLLVGYRAWGDWLYTLPALNYLLDNYNIHLETNNKGYVLFHDDPRFINKTYFEPFIYPEEDRWDIVHERWAAVEKEINPDKTINLFRTLEHSCIAEGYQDIFYSPRFVRRKVLGMQNFYDSVLKKCEVPKTYPINLEGLYFTEEQINWGLRFKENNKDYFNMLLVLSGSCAHKQLPQMKEVSEYLLDKHPKLKIYLMGDESTSNYQWEHNRVIKTAGTVPIKQAILMAKHADYVLGGETGLLVGAGMWGTPKTMLCTSCNIYQACKYHKNDYSIQSDINCSPCHRAVYTATDCYNVTKIEENEYYPNCILHFDINKILTLIERLYNNAM